MVRDLFSEADDEFRLRPYQYAAVEYVEAAWNVASTTSVSAYLATGLGKTEIIAELVRRAASKGLGSLVITPFVDLTGQTAGRLRSRGVACGIEQAALRSHDDVTVACYASLLSRNRWQDFVGRRSARVIVDEVHLNYSKNSLAMLTALMDSGAKVLGLTATPNRGGTPLSDFYGQPVYTYGYHQAVADGWLVPAKIWLTVLEDIDLSTFRRVNGDFEPQELARIMAQEKSIQPIGSMIEQHHEGLPMLVFGHSIRQCEQLVLNLARRGIEASIVHSKMDKAERQMHLHDFETGRTNIILNVGVLTTGYDFPPIRKIVIAKPTLQGSRYQQMIGRAMRPLPGGVDRFRTAAERVQWIAGSGKPHFEIFDLTDSSRLNELQTAVNALLPGEDEAIIRRVRKRVEKAGGVSNIDAILAEEKEAAAREQAAQDALTEHLRAGMVAHGTFTNYERDVNAKAESTGRGRRWTVMPFGKYKYQRFEVIPPDYLQWVLVNCTVKGPLRATIERYAFAKKRLA